MPWFATGREEKGQDHLHIVSGTETWSGRPLDVKTSTRATDMLAVELSHRLGFPEPHWLPPGTVELLGEIRKGAPAPAFEFADHMNQTMGLYLPALIEELDDALIRTGSNWSIQKSPTSDSLLVHRNEMTDERINPKKAGAAFSSVSIGERLFLASQIHMFRVTLIHTAATCVSHSFRPYSSIKERSLR